MHSWPTPVSIGNALADHWPANDGCAGEGPPGSAKPIFSRRHMKPKLYEGGCLCGSVRFRAVGEPGRPHTCSCTSCRRHSGSLSLTWVEFKAENVEWVGPGGKPSTWRSSPYSSRAFCSTCGTTIGAVDDEPTIAFATGAFDKPHLKELAPTYHSYVSRRPRWWHVHSDYEPTSKE